MCGVFGRRAAGSSAARLPRSRRRRCSRCSTAARSRPASPSATASSSCSTRTSAWSRRSSTSGGCPSPPRRPRDRPLPLFDDRLDGLGERAADLPVRPAPGARRRAQRQPRQYPRAARACPAGGDGLPATTDTELLTALLADEPASTPSTPCVRVLPRVRGAFSLVLLDERRVIGVRDPHGFRPLVLGRLPRRRPGRDDAAGLWPDDDARRLGPRRPRPPALDIVGAEFVRDVEPGEIVVLEPGREPRSVRYAEANPALCVFELIYFARPDSYMEGRNLYEVRRRMGMQLAGEHPVDADLVMPVPGHRRSGRGGVRGGVAASRTARAWSATGTPAGRSSSRRRRMRQRGVTMKLSPLREVVARPAADRWSTTRSCAARRPSRSWRCCARPARARSTSGSARRRSTTRASTASIRQVETELIAVDALARGDPRLHRRGLAGLPVDPGRPRGARPAVRAVLLRLLRRPLPGARPVRRRRAQVHARGPSVPARG